MCVLSRRYDSYEEYQHEKLKREEYRRDYEKREFERAEQRERQRQKAIVSQLPSRYLYRATLDFASSCAASDKRPHVITAVAQHTETSHRHTLIASDETASSPAPCATVSLH